MDAIALPETLFLVVHLDAQTYVIADAFATRAEAQFLASTLGTFSIVVIAKPSLGGDPYLCHLVEQGVRVLLIRPAMTPVAIVRRAGPSDIFWAPDAAAAEQQARSDLATRSWADPPTFTRRPIVPAES